MSLNLHLLVSPPSIIFLVISFYLCYSNILLVRVTFELLQLYDSNFISNIQLPFVFPQGESSCQRTIEVIQRQNKLNILEVLDKYKILLKNKVDEYPIVLPLDLANCQVGIENRCVQDEANVLYKLSKRWKGVLRFFTKLERWGKRGEHLLQYMEFFLEGKKCEVWKVIGGDPNLCWLFGKVFRVWDENHCL